MRRRHPALALVLTCLMAAGCGLGGDDRGGVRGEVQYGDTGSTSSTAAAAAVSDPEPGGETEPTAARRPGTVTSVDARAAAGTRAPDAESPTSPSDDDEPGTTLVDRGDDGSRGPPGAFARTLLRPQPATMVSVERFHQRYAEPEPESIARIDDVLRRATGGTKDIDVRDSVQLSGYGEEWTAEEIRALADERSRVSQGGRYAVIRMLFLGGTFDGDDSVLGIAVRGDTLAVFTNAIENAATPVIGATPSRRPSSSTSSGTCSGWSTSPGTPAARTPTTPGTPPIASR